MVIAVIAGVCVLLLVLGFLVPKLSRHPQRGTQKALGAGGRHSGRLPGALGRLSRKSFTKSNEAVGKSAKAGRKGRRKLPF